jgi:two-component sensor histidine kinase
LIGALLVGAKRDGGLYTQEEIEIAGATGERIIDTIAGEQMARRVMELQRKRLAENRVMDMRTRRLLHDETLPTLHAAVLRLSSLTRDEAAIREAINTLTEAHQQVANLIHTAQTLPTSSNGQHDIVKSLQDMVSAEFASEFNSISWQIAGDGFTAIDPLVQEIVLGATREVLRNAAIHGRGDSPTRPLNITIRVHGEEDFALVIHDDGVGVNYPATVKAGGSGGGLALHSTMLAIVGGYLTVEPSSDGGTSVRISLPS